MDKLAIIMCTWKRINFLSNTIKMLESQTINNFTFFIWNNNSNINEKIKDVIKNSNLNIEVYNSNENIGGIGRFYYAKKINKEYDKILFIDDDQKFSNKFVEQMLSYYDTKSIISWWGWKINNSYFVRERKTNLENVDYCGTGGMILPSKLFENDIIFQIPKKYQFIEDLWLSFVAKCELGYNLKGCKADIEIIVDGNDQYVNLKKLKEEFYKFLIDTYVKKK
jgi:GT2 family glycosyltransferase